jgi:VWFA-related protein
MKKFFPLIVMLLLATGFALGQGITITPTPTPAAADDDVVEISTNLIQLDVTVTDAKGKTVTDLRPDEIEIYENGHKQKITNFNFISAAAPAEKAKNVKPDPLAPPLPPTRLRPEQVRRTFALVVDDLGLSFESAYQTKRALKKFVDEQIEDGDLVAIIRTGAGIGALQQFTSDKRLLYAAIDKVRWNPTGTGGVGAFAPLEPTPMERLRASGDATVSDEEIQQEKDLANANKDFRNSTFITGTLGALKFVIEGMRELPGRKSVILMSDGFPLFERDETGYMSGSIVLDSMTELIDVANRSSVVIYTLDPRGLQSTYLTAQDQLGDDSPEAASNAVSDRNHELHDTQDGLVYLARQTGGFAIINNNDLAAGVRRVMNDQSYYLIGYEPDPDTFDRTKLKFNKFDVKVLRKGVTARYRSGFLNVADREKPSTGNAVGTTPLAQLQNALITPFGTNGIEVRLNALFGSDEKSMPYVRSLLHIKASDLKFTDGRDGAKKAAFDVLAMSFGDNGQVVDQLAKSYTLEAKGDTLQKLMTDGFVYHFTFPVKKPGAYQYRVAIRDAQGARVGSASQFVEIPNLKKSGLTLSSLVLENLSAADWKASGVAPDAHTAADPMADTALRRIKLGTVLRYGFEIYNAKLDAAKQPHVETQVRVFRDRKLILDGARHPIDMNGQTDVRRLRSSGAMAIGDKLQAGDYILQVVVFDTLANAKKQIATRFVEFEVVN